MEQIITELQVDFFKNGWCEIKPELIGFSNNISDSISRIKKSEYQLSAKNLGIFSLPQKRINEHRIFNQIFKNESFINYVEIITGRRLEISCIMQMLTIGESKSLQWHRDSYSRGNNFIGPIPQVVKLMLLNETVTNQDGPFQVISGSHILDFNNKVFDKILPFIKMKDIKSFSCKKNTCILFDGRILHRRLFSTKKAKRSVTIISLTSPYK